jgi:hypothetical protein
MMRTEGFADEEAAAAPGCPSFSSAMAERVWGQAI